MIIMPILQMRKQVLEVSYLFKVTQLVGGGDRHDIKWSAQSTCNLYKLRRRRICSSRTEDTHSIGGAEI